MANEEHLVRLKQGVDAWNAWRKEKHEEAHARSKQKVTTHDQWQKENPDYWPDLTEADLSEVDLFQGNLEGVNLWGTNLSGANLNGAALFKANLIEADLIGTNLAHADLEQAYLTQADLKGANLSKAQLMEADLVDANLAEVNLTGADLRNADLSEANLSQADLRSANLTRARLVETNFEGANLTGCTIYGISAWQVNLAGAQQLDLVITQPDEPMITVDNLEMAQFIYLLLHNEKIRAVIDTITSKAVLILGRFTPKRKAVLDALREELRQRNYLPILFDFEKPASRDLTETISTLAHMARFIIADLSDARSIPQELQRIIPDLPSVPVKPLLQGSAEEYSMFEHFKSYSWVLPPYRYKSTKEVIASLTKKVIAPAELKAKRLLATKRK
jgi:uncharacterized protein YjbI with pentapeptide repeats